MNWPYVLALFVSTAAAIYVCIVAWERRSAPGARPLMVLGSAIAVWTLTYAIHFSVVAEAARFFWLRATWEEVLRAADQAMYAAKEAGRNCTRTAN